jgi:hypothetical protein
VCRPEDGEGAMLSKSDVKKVLSKIMKNHMKTFMAQKEEQDIMLEEM